MRTKVLHIIKSLGRGGAETLLPETLRLHDQQKFEFHYVYFLPWKNQLEETITQNGGEVICLPSSNNIQIIWKLKSLINYVKQNEIQLIHCHLPWAGIVGRLVHKFTGIPVIYTEHNKQERYHFLTKWMNRLTFNWQTAAIAVSNDVEVSIRENIHPTIPVQTILNGVNTDYFQRDCGKGKEIRSALGIPAEALVVGTVSVFRFQKRLKEWLEVFAQALENNPQLYGIIVGDGPLREDVERHRRQLGLEERVILAGLQTDVKPYYAAMDVFMMTSLFEGLPISMLEAMSMECVIITTDAGGIKDVIRDGVDGRIVSTDQWNQLAEILVELSADKSLIVNYSKSARQRVQTSFSLTTMVHHLETLYTSLAPKA